MPHFSLPSSNGDIFHSQAHLPLIVYFYPKDHTAGCTTEGLDFNRLLDSAGNIAHEWRKVKVAGHAEAVLAAVKNG